MIVVKSRTEIALTRLVNKVMTNNTDDLSQEWRLPKFVSACEEWLSSVHGSVIAPIRLEASSSMADSNLDKWKVSWRI